jgi:hypothetical protein
MGSTGGRRLMSVGRAGAGHNGPEEQQIKAVISYDIAELHTPLIKVSGRHLV